MRIAKKFKKGKWKSTKNTGKNITINNKEEENIAANYKVNNKDKMKFQSSKCSVKQLRIIREF